MPGLTEVAPPGFGHTKSGKGDEKGGTAAAFDRARKEGRFKGSKSDMFAIMWAQKNKGDKPHYKPGTNKKYKKYQEDAQYGYDKKGKSLNPKDIKKRNKKADEEAHKPAIEDWVSSPAMTATESLSVKDAKKLNKAAALSQSDDPKDQDRARARQTEIDYKDLMRQRKTGKVGVGKSMEEGRSWKEWKQAAKDAVGRKTPKHDYGKDAGAEAAKRLRKRDHDKVNFLDPED